MYSRSRIPQVAILVGTSIGWGRGIVKGILSHARQVGPWQVWLKPEPEIYNELPDGWQGNGVIADVENEELADALRDSGLPVVSVAGSVPKGFSVPNVRTDDRVGAQLAIDHFFERGFRNFAFAAPGRDSNPSWYAKTYRELLGMKGLKCAVHFNDSEASGTLADWLVALPKPIGITVWGNTFGREVVDTCMELGISVPHDVAVIGGNYDVLLSHACSPDMSGFLSPSEQIGRRAASLLQRMMNGEEVPSEPVFIPPTGIMECLSTSTLATDDPKLIQVIEFIRAHAFESITMESILREVPMARRSLERRFVQVFGRSPREEIRRLRMNKARELLAKSDLPMQQIAEACGYATYNYLSQAFKQMTGSTPRDYRKASRIG